MGKELGWLECDTARAAPSAGHTAVLCWAPLSPRSGAVPPLVWDCFSEIRPSNLAFSKVTICHV